MLVAAGIEAWRNDSEKASVITFRRVSTNDSTDPKASESRADKKDSAGLKNRSDSSFDPSRPSNSRNGSSLNTAGSAASGDTGDRYGNSSEETRIRLLVEQGMAEDLARVSVLGNGHSPFCDCEACLWVLAPAGYYAAPPVPAGSGP
ncbi:MAG TPA: hypothetical protein VEZ19_02665, partial [Rubrobacter sp.]|nr:hypothetical protein [Rubrobacter sp.]